jgi:hypothetical protein
MSINLARKGLAAERGFFPLALDLSDFRLLQNVG